MGQQDRSKALRTQLKEIQLALLTAAGAEVQTLEHMYECVSHQVLGVTPTHSATGYVSRVEC